ncbi:sigma factor-like helix-turn-helix DNA-binding protein [Sphingomonas sp. OTU376]|uniref:sigma factor-like helix-turn-helix DNA-binding protein n=1 Tax=Sphingomonas sp. OTU376 TaxID=3043863 RepID=UPI00313C5636
MAGSSETQRRCLLLVGRGLRTKEIAKELGLAPNTVDTYLRQSIGRSASNPVTRPSRRSWPSFSRASCFCRSSSSRLK